MNKAAILIVEDEAALSDAYTTILTKEGYKTFAAFNGKEALKIIESNLIDLILLDLRMPHMGGLDFLKEFKNIKKPLPKTVIFSNYDEQKDIDEAFKHGAIKYMLKAWASPKELVKLVSDILAS